MCRQSGLPLTFIVQLRVNDFPDVLRLSLTPPGASNNTLFQCFYCKDCDHFKACDRLLRWVQPTYQDPERRPAACSPCDGRAR
jgi:hypothetical protein